MTNDQRRAFGNLILLCRAHHKTVDGRRRGEFPIEALAQWKTANEPPDGIEALASAGLTDDILEEVMQEVVARMGLTREVEVDLTAALLLSSTDLASVGDLEAMKVILEANPHLKHQPRLLVTNIRNTGTLAVTVEGVDLWVQLGDPDNPSQFTLMGRNDFGESNPRLPNRLEDGSAVRWMTKMETISDIVEHARANGFSVVGVRSKVRLGTGEQVQSRPLPWIDPEAPTPIEPIV